MYLLLVFFSTDSTINMLFRIFSFSLSLFILLLVGCISAHAQTPKSPAALQKIAQERVDIFLDSLNRNFPVLGKVKRDSVRVSTNPKGVFLYFNAVLGYIPLRPETVGELRLALRDLLVAEFVGYTLNIYSNGKPLDALVPNYYRAPAARDTARLPRLSTAQVPLVARPDRVWSFQGGLSGRHIALWHSHGWYYEPSLQRWEWQRARVFQTVEDLLPAGFVLPYLVPMLEGAGANVLLPRERDWQTNEVVVDNDVPTTGLETFAIRADRSFRQGEGTGYGFQSTYQEGENPFEKGSYLVLETEMKQSSAHVRWTPTIPERGRYAVYVAYASLPNSTEAARYTVHHSGGTTDFSVNQQMGGGTWVYLGHFDFEAGKNAARGSVLVTNQSAKSKEVITADAVRFGGGMGNIVREGATSGRPRFVEAARYYMQYSGVPDTLVYHLNKNDDYRDDYQSRGEWVSYLKGAPFGPAKNRNAKGLRIPIDLALAFHTDAGFTRNDTVVGTLMIYSTAADKGAFPDGVSRLASRDFADMLQTELVNDIRALYDSTWTRRGLWDKDYSEAYRPTVPTALLELLSHHNFTDMKFALDPRFRFDVSRSIYKAITRYLADASGTPYHIQPLPVSHFQATLNAQHEIALKWQPVADLREPTAVPAGYLVYTACDSSGFDNGTFTSQPFWVLGDPKPGQLYRFKVAAVNAGGEGFPSEELSVVFQGKEARTALVVNGFDRVSAAASLETEGFMGFTNFADEGVPFHYDLDFIGTQYDFDPNSPWLDDDAPGHGASHSDYETHVIAGNTFNFVAIHADALRRLGFNVVSCSNEVVEEGLLNLKPYPLLDWLAGEQKSTPGIKYRTDTTFRVFPTRTQQQLRNYLQQGGQLFVSGAHIGTDLAAGKPKNHPDVRFAQEVLQFTWRTNHASKEGTLHPTHPAFQQKQDLVFNTTFSATQYRVEAPDALEPASAKGKTIFRYNNTKSAGVAYKERYGVVALGFPFESVTDAPARDALMRSVVTFLLGK